MKSLVIYGASYPDIVKLVDAINVHKPAWRLYGFLDDSLATSHSSFMGLPILGGSEKLQELVSQGHYFVNNVCSTTVNHRKITNLLHSNGASMPNMIFPDADLRYVELGHGCIISPGVILGANVFIGNHVVIRKGAILNHDNRIDDFAYLGASATLCGHVHVRDGAYIGAGATIRERVTIGAWSTIGLGAAVVSDIPEYAVAYGVPAKPRNSPRSTDFLP